MPKRGGKKKRRSRDDDDSSVDDGDDGAWCEDCHVTRIVFGDYAAGGPEFSRCGSCLKLLCEDCMKRVPVCAVCKEREEAGVDGVFMNSCSACSENCDDCARVHAVAAAKAGSALTAKGGEVEDGEGDVNLYAHYRPPAFHGRCLPEHLARKCCDANYCATRVFWAAEWDELGAEVSLDKAKGELEELRRKVEELEVKRAAAGKRKLQAQRQLRLVQVAAAGQENAVAQQQAAQVDAVAVASSTL